MVFRVTTTQGKLHLSLQNLSGGVEEGRLSPGPGFLPPV